MEFEREASSVAGRSSPILLSIGAAVASISCVAVIVFEGLMRHGKGPDWSVSALGLIVRHGVWLLVFAGIAWMAIAALGRAVAGNRSTVVSTLVVNALAGISLLFSVGAAVVTTYGTFELAKHPNRRIYSLYSAACKADKEAVKRALADGVSPTELWTDISPGDGGDALAAYFKCYKPGQPFDQELVDILLAAGSSLASRPQGYGTPPLEVVLISAPQEDRVRAAEYLVGKGLSPNGAPNSSWSPLAIAAGRGDVETAKALLSLGARSDVPNLADKLFTSNQQFCSDSAQRWPDTARFDIQKYFAVADLLVEHGLKITQAALQKGKAFCPSAENLMATHIESRMNKDLAK